MNSFIDSPHEDYRQFDGEWVSFINSLSKNETLYKIAHFALHSRFTARAKRKIIAHTYALLGRNLAITYINDAHDRNILYCDKAVMDSVLKLGMTNFDLTPEFESIMNMISTQFTVMVFQAHGGFERRSINTQERKVSTEERLLPLPQQNFIDQAKGKLGLQ